MDQNEDKVKSPIRETIDFNKDGLSTPHRSQIRSGSMIRSVRKNIFDRYKKISLLGEGAYGQVYKVEQTGNGVLRAMKILDKKRTQVPISGLVQEVDNMRRLDHPNILRVYEVSQDENNVYIVSQLSTGSELFNEIHRRIRLRKQGKPTFTEEEIQSIIRQLLSAICYAHENGIIHRDIKPENILLETEGNEFNVLVIDWGLSKDISKQVMIRQRIGTVDYAAPEVLKGQQYDGRADVWSIGVILYILLSGQSPFPGQTTGEIEAMIVTSKGLDFNVASLKNSSSGAIDLMRQMLQPSIDKRLTAQEAIKHPWLHEQGNHIHSINETTLERLEKFCCKNLLIQATSHFLVSECVDPEKQQELRMTFKKLDIDGDGKLSLLELTEGLADQVPECKVLEIFNNIDTDKSVKGFIDYTEFLLASANLKKATQINRIQEAFQLYDVDGDGYIELSEIKNILTPIEGDIDDEVWDKLLGELDEDGDEKISFDEYRRAIEKFISQIPNSIMGSLENEDYEPPLKKSVILQSKNVQKIQQKQNSNQVKKSVENSAQKSEKSNTSQNSYNLRNKNGKSYRNFDI